MNTGYIEISASTTAEQVAEALGVSFFTSGSYTIFHMPGDTTAGFTVVGVGTGSWSIFTYYNGSTHTSDSDLLDTLGSKLYYRKTDNYIFFGSSPSNLQIYKGFIKGKSSQDGSEMWTCFSICKYNNPYGYLWDKYSSSVKALNANFGFVGTPSFLSLCPMFNADTGFYATDGAFYTAYRPSYINTSSTVHLVAMGDRTLDVVTNYNTVYINFAFDVTA